MTTITTPAGHRVRVHPLHALFMRPEDAAEQACFSRLAAEGRDSEVRAVLRRAEQAARLHIANREWAIQEQAI